MSWITPDQQPEPEQPKPEPAPLPEGWQPAPLGELLWELATAEMSVISAIIHGPTPEAGEEDQL